MNSNIHQTRPETHWLREVMKLGRKGSDGTPGAGEVWFSLQLTLERAKELYNAFARQSPCRPFDKLVQAGALMAPSSHAALNFAIEANWTDPGWDTVGTDILVPPGALAELEKLANATGVAITDAGLAIPTGSKVSQPT